MKRLYNSLKKANRVGFRYKPSQAKSDEVLYTLKALRKLLKSINILLLKGSISVSSELDYCLVEIIKLVANAIFEMKGRDCLRLVCESLGTYHIYIDAYVVGPYLLEFSDEEVEVAA